MGPIGSQLGSFILLVNWKWKKPNFGLNHEPGLKLGLKQRRKGRLQEGAKTSCLKSTRLQPCCLFFDPKVNLSTWPNHLLNQLAICEALCPRVDIGRSQGTTCRLDLVVASYQGKKHNC